MAHTFNPSRGRSELKPAWSTKQIPAQPRLHRETVSGGKKKSSMAILLEKPSIVSGD